jgi:putative FmdB family regulatory protein
MALYEYNCSSCGTTFEQRMPMAEVKQVMPCTNCKKDAKKTFGNFAVVGRAEAAFGDGPAPWETVADDMGMDLDELSEAGMPDMGGAGMPDMGGHSHGPGGHTH